MPSRLDDRYDDDRGVYDQDYLRSRQSQRDALRRQGIYGLGGYGGRYDPQDDYWRRQWGGQVRPDFQRPGQADRRGEMEYFPGPGREMSIRGEYSRPSRRSHPGRFNRNWRPEQESGLSQRMSARSGSHQSGYGTGGEYGTESDWDRGYGQGYDEGMLRNWEMDDDQASLRRGPIHTGSGPVAGPFSGLGPRGYQRSNERIFEDVCQRLTQNGQVDASDLEFDVRDGEVYLRGTVPERRMKRIAEDIISDVPGVLDVVNEVKINATESGR